VEDNPVISRRLFPACVATGNDQICGLERTRRWWHPRAPYLEIRFEDPDDLSARWPEDGDGLDWQVFGLEAQLVSGGRGYHGGRRLKTLVGKVIIGLRCAHVSPSVPAELTRHCTSLRWSG